MKKALLILPFIIFAFGCTPAEKSTSPIHNAGWLVGTWECRTANGSFFEQWVRINDNELSGKSYRLENADTIVLETIRLVQNNDSLFYIPSVLGQNDGAEIRFSSVLIADRFLVFENPQHDFPQKISYFLIGRDSLMAEISGMNGGLVQTRSFPMKRLE